MIAEQKDRIWYVFGLPDLPGQQGKRYEFTIGVQPAFEAGKLYLHIPEFPHLDAERSPLFPEQCAWIEQLIQQGKLRAKLVWWYTWEFQDQAAVDDFENRLRALGGYQAKKSRVL